MTLAAARALAPRLLALGDGAVTVEFGAAISPALSAQVAALDRAVQAACAEGRLPGVLETVPTFRSLTVLYDPLRTSRAELDPLLTALCEAPADTQAAAVRRWRLPVCYGNDFGVDLPAVAEAAGLTPEAVVALHAGATFQVLMLGFLPGFPFLGGLPEVLALPRRREPRVRVPAGSVAVAAGLSAIYPSASPGGWHLLGRCPVPLFDAAAAEPVLLAPGDELRFEPVSAARHAEIAAALAAGELRPQAFRAFA